MVRETRHLWVGNLPENISEERIKEHFKRYGPVQSVKVVSGGSDEGLSATIAFVDICSAAKAHKADHRIDERLLKTSYYEPALISNLISLRESSSHSHFSSSGSSPVSSHVSHDSRSPRYSTSLSEEHHSYDRSSHFYENRRDDPLPYNGRSGSLSTGPQVNIRRGAYPSDRDSEFSSGTRSRIRSYPPRGHFLSNGRGDPSDYRWPPSETQYRYHADGYVEDKLRRSSQQQGLSPPPPVLPRASARSLRHPMPVINKRRHRTSRSGSESPSSGRSSRSSSSSSSSSSCSRSSSSRSGSLGRLSRADSQSPRPMGNASQTLPHVPILSPPAEKRPLGLSIKNLPPWSSDNSLKEGLFHDYKKHGKVIDVRIFGSGSDRYAIVYFKKSEDAEKAFGASHEKQFFGVKIQVSQHEGLELDENDYRSYDVELDEFHPKATRTLFIGGLDKNVTAAELRKQFEAFGEIIEIDIKKQNMSTFAFCQFADIRSVVQAVKKMDGEFVGGNRVKLGFGKSMPNRCVWVGGISESVSESAFCESFKRFGTITHRSLDREKGHALVAFETERHASTSVAEMRGYLMGGKKLQIDFASRECQVAFYENLNKQEFSSPSEKSWDRRDTEKSERGRREGGSYVARQPTTQQRVTSFSRTGTRTRFDGFDEFSTGRNFEEFVDNSFERELHEYAGRQRSDTGSVASAAHSPTSTVSTSSGTTKNRSFSPVRKRSADHSPPLSPHSVTKDSNCPPSPIPDSEPKKCFPQRTISDQDSFHSQSPPPRGRSRLPSLSPSASSTISPLREVTVAPEDPRKRKPSCDLKDIVVRVNEARRSSDSPVRRRSSVRIGSTDMDVDDLSEVSTSTQKSEMQDPRILRNHEPISSGDEQHPLDNERPPKKSKYSEPVSVFDKNAKRCLESSECNRVRSNSPNFRKPFESSKRPEPIKYATKKDNRMSDDPIRSPLLDPRRRKSVSSDVDENSAWHNKESSSGSICNGEFLGDSSPPGTPVRDEREEPLLDSSNRRPSHPFYRIKERHSPMYLPLPKFAAAARPHLSPRPVCPSPRGGSVLKSPTFNTSASWPPHSLEPLNIVTTESDSLLADTPVSPGPGVIDNHSDSEENGNNAHLNLAPELYERIKALDEKYEKWTGSARCLGMSMSAEKSSTLTSSTESTSTTTVATTTTTSLRKKRILDLNELKSQQPSDIMKSLLSKRSVFDEDSERLENVSDKYEPRPFVSVAKTSSFSSILSTVSSVATGTTVSSAVPSSTVLPVPSATPLNSLPGIRRTSTVVTSVLSPKTVVSSVNACSSQSSSVSSVTQPHRNPVKLPLTQVETSQNTSVVQHVSTHTSTTCSTSVSVVSCSVNQRRSSGIHASDSSATKVESHEHEPVSVENIPISTPASAVSISVQATISNSVSVKSDLSSQSVSCSTSLSSLSSNSVCTSVISDVRPRVTLSTERRKSTNESSCSVTQNTEKKSVSKEPEVNNETNQMLQILKSPDVEKDVLKGSNLNIVKTDVIPKIKIESESSYARHDSINNNKRRLSSDCDSVDKKSQKLKSLDHGSSKSSEPDSKKLKVEPEDDHEGSSKLMKHPRDKDSVCKIEEKRKEKTKSSIKKEESSEIDMKNTPVLQNSNSEASQESKHEKIETKEKIEVILKSKEEKTKEENKRERLDERDTKDHKPPTDKHLHRLNLHDKERSFHHDNQEKASVVSEPVNTTLGKGTSVDKSSHEKNVHIERSSSHHDRAASHHHERSSHHERSVEKSRTCDKTHEKRSERRDEKRDVERREDKRDVERREDKRDVERREEKRDVERREEKRDVERREDKRDVERREDKRDVERREDKRDVERRDEKRDVERREEKRDVERREDKRDVERREDKRDVERRDEKREDKRDIERREDKRDIERREEKRDEKRDIEKREDKRDIERREDKRDIERREDKRDIERREDKRDIERREDKREDKRDVERRDERREDKRDVKVETRDDKHEEVKRRDIKEDRSERHGEDRRRHSEDSRSRDDRRDKGRDRREKDKSREKDRHKQPSSNHSERDRDNEKGRTKDRERDRSSNKNRYKRDSKPPSLNKSEDKSRSHSEKKERRDNQSSLSSPLDHLSNYSERHSKKSNLKKHSVHSSQEYSVDSDFNTSSGSLKSNRESSKNREPSHKSIDTDRSTKEAYKKKHESSKRENKEKSNLPKSSSHYSKPKTDILHNDVEKERMESEGMSSDDDLKHKLIAQPAKRNKRVTSSSSGSRRGRPKGKSIMDTESDSLDSGSDTEDKPKKASYFDITIYDGNMYDKVKARREKSALKQEEEIKQEEMKQKLMKSRSKKCKKNMLNFHSALISESEETDTEIRRKRSQIRIHSSSDEDSFTTRTHRKHLSSDDSDDDDDISSGATKNNQLKIHSKLSHVSDITSEEEVSMPNNHPLKLLNSDSDSEPIKIRKECSKIESDSELSESDGRKPPRPALSVSRGRIKEKEHRNKITKPFQSVKEERVEMESELMLLSEEIRHMKPKIRPETVEAVCHSKVVLHSDPQHLSESVVVKEKRKEGRMKAIFGLMSDDSDSNTAPTSSMPLTPNLLSTTSYRKESTSSGASSEPQSMTSPNISRIHPMYDDLDDLEAVTHEPIQNKDSNSFDSSNTLQECELKSLVLHKGSVTKDDILRPGWREVRDHSGKEPCENTRTSDSGKGSSGVSTTSSSSGSSAEELLLLEASGLLPFKEESNTKKSSKKSHSKEESGSKEGSSRKEKKKKKKHKDKSHRWSSSRESMEMDKPHHYECSSPHKSSLKDNLNGYLPSKNKLTYSMESSDQNKGKEKLSDVEEVIFEESTPIKREECKLDGDILDMPIIKHEIIEECVEVSSKEKEHISKASEIQADSESAVQSIASCSSPLQTQKSFVDIQEVSCSPVQEVGVDQSPSKPLSSISQEETLNAVAGLLACYNDYQEEEISHGETSHPNDATPPIENPNEQCEEAQKAAQLLQSENEVSRGLTNEGSNIWESAAPLNQSTDDSIGDQLQTSSLSENSDKQSNAPSSAFKESPLSPMKEYLDNSETQQETAVQLPDSPSSVQSEPELQIDEDNEDLTSSNTNLEKASESIITPPDRSSVWNTPESDIIEAKQSILDEQEDLKSKILNEDDKTSSSIDNDSKSELQSLVSKSPEVPEDTMVVNSETGFLEQPEEAEVDVKESETPNDQEDIKSEVKQVESDLSDSLPVAKDEIENIPKTEITDNSESSQVEKEVVLPPKEETKEEITVPKNEDLALTVNQPELKVEEYSQEIKDKVEAEDKTEKTVEPIVLRRRSSEVVTVENITPSSISDTPINVPNELPEETAGRLLTRGNARGRGRRGARKISEVSQSSSEPPVTRLSANTRSSKGRGRGQITRTTEVTDESSLDTSSGDQLRRSTRMKRARKHPDMVEHDETTNKRKRGGKVNKNATEDGRGLQTSSSDVYDFHDSDEGDSKLALGKKGKKGVNKNTTPRPVKPAEEQQIDSSSSDSALKRKSLRLKEKAPEDELVSAASEAEDENAPIPITRSRGRVKKDTETEEEQSPRKSPRAKKPENEIPEPDITGVNETSMGNVVIQKVDAQAPVPVTSAVPIPKALIIPCPPNKTFPSSIPTSTTAPTTNLATVPLSIATIGNHPLKLSIVQSSSAKAVGKPVLGTVVSVPKILPINASGSLLTVTSVPASYIQREIVSHVSTPMTVINTSQVTVNSIKTIPVTAKSMLSVDPSSISHSAFKAFPHKKIDNIPTPLVDPVTGHLTPMKISDEGHYIPIGEQLSLCAKDKMGNPIPQTKVLRAVLPSNITVTTLTGSNPPLPVSLPTSSSSVTTSSRPLSLASLPKGVAVTSLPRGSEVSVELVSRVRPPVPHPPAANIVLSQKAPSNYATKIQPQITFSSHSPGNALSSNNLPQVSASSNVASVNPGKPITSVPSAIVTKSTAARSSVIGGIVPLTKTFPVKHLVPVAKVSPNLNAQNVILPPSAGHSPSGQKSDHQSQIGPAHLGQPQVATSTSVVSVSRIPPAIKTNVGTPMPVEYHNVSVSRYAEHPVRYRDAPVVEVARLPVGSPSAAALSPVPRNDADVTLISSRQHFELSAAQATHVKQGPRGSASVVPHTQQPLNKTNLNSYYAELPKKAGPPPTPAQTVPPPSVGPERYLTSPPLHTPPSNHSTPTPTPPPAHLTPTMRDNHPLNPLYHRTPYLITDPRAVYGDKIPNMGTLPIDLKLIEKGPPGDKLHPDEFSPRPGGGIPPHNSSSPHHMSPHFDRATDSPQVTMMYNRRYPHYEASLYQNRSGTPGSVEHETLPRSPLPYGPHPPTEGHHSPRIQVPGTTYTPQVSPQLPPQPDSIQYLLQNYPVMWDGFLGLKNEQTLVKMHFVSGSVDVARGALPEGSTSHIRISQRMRLEQSQLDGVARKMLMKAEHCVLMALPYGRNPYELMQQQMSLESGFIKYLGEEKKAAGIVNVHLPGSHQSAFVIHIFPPCEFANDNLYRIAPDLHGIASSSRLLVVIATC